MRPRLVPIIFGDTRRDPVYLFSKYNVSGFLFDRFDPAYGLLFQDQANTPSDADGEAVGLSLSRDGGLLVGSELFSNGDFSQADVSDWARGFNSVDGTLAVVGGQLIHTKGSGDGSNPRWVRAFSGLTTGRYYRLVVGTYTFTGDCRIGWTSQSSGTGGFELTAAGLYTLQATATTMYVAMMFIGGTAGATQALDNASLKLIAGNHGLQATAGSKSTLRQVNSRWLIRGDGVDDNLLTALNAATSMTLIEVGTPDSGSQSDVLMGSQPASDGRAYLALNSSGYLAGGVGTQSTSTIADANSQDIRSVRCGKAIRWDGSNVQLYLMLPGGAFQKVYDAAQSGAANTTIPLRVLALNANGSASAPADSDSEMFFAIQAAMSENDIRAAMRWKL